MLSQPKGKKENPVIAYPFPVQAQQSLYFATTNAKVVKAILTANNTTLSIVNVQPGEKLTDIVDINFFGGKPFHGGLAAKWKVVVTLHVEGNEIPSLVMKPADTDVTWDNVPCNDTVKYYCEDVTTGSTSGEKNLTLVYTPLFGGFKSRD
ncbi:hypothetical protein PV-S19_0326 [Pacmanvirus S19]|nr:hypothetical protein PV-S19_0326 [Pacmanvirus S19]